MKLISITGLVIIISLNTTFLIAQHISSQSTSPAYSGDIYHLSGRIGIGTTTPKSNLELVSSPYFTAYDANSFVIRSSNSPSTNDSRILGMTITFDNSNNVHSSSQKSVGIFAQSSGGWSNSVDMLFYTRGYSQAPYFSEKMRIKSNGNVGIGTTSPSVKLDVSGTVQGSNMGRFKGWATGGESGLGFEIGTSSGEGYAYVYDRTNSAYGTMHIQNVIHTSGNNGNVGIGTSSPNSKLEIRGSGSGSSALSIIENSGSTVGAHFTSEGYNNIMFQLKRTSDSNVNTELRSSGNSFLNALSGNVGIGIGNPSYKLDVNGTIHAREVLVDLNFPGPDYVFEEGYPLASLTEIEAYIQQNKHLPEVPSAAQMKEEGVNVIEMQMLLLKKVEELTLLLIKQNHKTLDLKEEKDAEIRLLKEESEKQRLIIKQLSEVLNH